MKVLVACEFSGNVRDAFITLGHEAISCDVVHSVSPGPHIRDDVLNHLDDGWDMMIGFPPCTYLASVGANRWHLVAQEQAWAIEFFEALLSANIPRIALENPVGILSRKVRKPDQYVQPFWFGESYSKKTGLWLKNLPPLRPANFIFDHIVGHGWGKGVPHTMRGRSVTPQGLANAMALQWGGVL